MTTAAFIRAFHRRALWLLMAVLVLPAAQSAAQQTLQIPAYTGYVNDFAGVVPADTRAALTSLSERVNAATRGDMVFVTLADIGDRAPSDVALQIGRDWKVGAKADIGDKARNAGVVILLVPKETSSINRGSCFIATGQGAEGFITDATSGSICREATPYFAQRDYAQGLMLVAERVAQRYASEFNVSLDGVPAAPTQQPARSRGRSGGGTSGILIVLVVFIILSASRGRGGRSGCLNMLPFLIASSGNNHRGGGWGGGGFGGDGGGGFGGFGGGGGFSGGGGGSNW